MDILNSLGKRRLIGRNNKANRIKRMLRIGDGEEAGLRKQRKQKLCDEEM